MCSPGCLLYGQEMFAAGRSCGRYAETINSIAAARPLIKKQLTAAWDLAFCWLSDEPHQHHPAMPRSVLLAACSLSLMWGWPYVASVLCVGWSGIMRIGEVRSYHGKKVRLGAALRLRTWPQVHLGKDSDPKNTSKISKASISQDRPLRPGQADYSSLQEL